MANYQLTVENRTETGKSYARKLRAMHKIPAVVYGSGKQAMGVEVPVREAEKALTAQGTLINLKLGESTKTVIVKDIHRDPVRGSLLHLDFHEIDMSKKLEITVPIRIVGEESRPSDGGVVTTLLWEVTVSCLPVDIPEAIAVDVAELELDEVVSVADLQVPEGVEVLDDAHEAVAKVDIPSLEIEEDVDEDAEEAVDEDTLDTEPAEEVGEAETE